MNVTTVKGHRISEVVAAISARSGEDRARIAATLVSAFQQVSLLHLALHRGAPQEALCLMAQALELTLAQAVKVCGVDYGDAEALSRAMEADTGDAVAKAQHQRGAES